MGRKETLAIIAENSKKKLTKVQGTIPFGQICKAWCESNDIEFEGDEDEVWHYRGTTVRESDTIMKPAQAGDHNQALCRAIHIRACTESGKKLFQPRDLDTIQSLDPEIIHSCIAYMGGYDAIIDDANPDTETMAKNSDSTHEPG